MALKLIHLAFIIFHIILSIIAVNAKENNKLCLSSYLFFGRLALICLTGTVISAFLLIWS